MFITHFIFTSSAGKLALLFRDTVTSLLLPPPSRISLIREEISWGILPAQHCVKSFSTEVDVFKFRAVLSFSIWRRKGHATVIFLNHNLYVSTQLVRVSDVHSPTVPFEPVQVCDVFFQ